MNIVVLDGFTANPGDLSWEPLARLGTLRVFDRTPPEHVLDHADGAEAVLTNKVRLNRETIRKLTAMRYIGVLATGCNILHMPTVAKRGIVVSNVPDYSSDSVAEHVFAMLLELARSVGAHAQAVRKGRWSRCADFSFWNHPMRELAGLTMGVVGYGHTGRAVVRRALAFGMRVLVHTRTPPAPPPADVTFCELDRVFAEADVVSLHVPLTPETEQLANERRLRLLKPDAWFVNTSRGGVVDEAALARVLQEGRIDAAALDVLGEEPPPLDHPLFRLPNCMITPHHAWASRAARERLIRIAADNLAAFAAGRPQNVVPTGDPAHAGGGEEG